MRCTSRFLIALGIILSLGVWTASAQTVSDMNNTLDTLFGDHARYQTFFEQLQNAVASDDKQAIASMVEYPILARIKGKAIKIRDHKQFEANYARIMTQKVKEAVARQNYPLLFANWQGVSVGEGEIWFSGMGKNIVKIAAIND
ncbi:hypothetical protein G6L33_22875 [Agrobacterium rhizogenes]|nr:hypothetical protein [Rhizobium rhizogenes]NTH66706.1 hypothetical protein [Rhizobium rhizogenes]